MDEQHAPLGRLPEGWEQWADLPGATALRLPAGWHTQVDANGMQYFVDNIHEETSYVHPFFQATDHSSLMGKVAVVTGANSGIGFATAEGLAALGARVILACRSVERGAAAAERMRKGNPDAQVHVCELNLASTASIRSFAARMAEEEIRINILVCNAAVYGIPLTIIKPDEDAPGLEATFVINYLGHFLLANLLLKPLRAGALSCGHESRVVVVTDDAHRRCSGLDFKQLPVTDVNSYDAPMVYCQTKLCGVLFAAELARRYRDLGNLGRQSWWYQAGWTLAWPVSSTAHQAAHHVIRCCVAPAVEGLGGRYFFESTEARPLKLGPEAAEKLWQYSADLAGLTELHDEQQQQKEEHAAEN